MKNINEEIMKRKKLISSSREIDLDYLKMLDREIEILIQYLKEYLEIIWIC